MNSAFDFESIPLIKIWKDVIRETDKGMNYHDLLFITDALEANIISFVSLSLVLCWSLCFRLCSAEIIVNVSLEAGADTDLANGRWEVKKIENDYHVEIDRE